MVPSIHRQTWSKVKTRAPIWTSNSTETKFHLSEPTSHFKNPYPRKVQLSDPTSILYFPPSNYRILEKNLKNSKFVGSGYKSSTGVYNKPLLDQPVKVFHKRRWWRWMHQFQVLETSSIALADQTGTDATDRIRTYDSPGVTVMQSVQLSCSSTVMSGLLLTAAFTLSCGCAAAAAFEVSLSEPWLRIPRADDQRIASCPLF